MSWDKNTVRVSQLDGIRETLDSLKYPYTLTLLGKVRGHGINDNWEAPHTEHEIRRLQYGDYVILEQIERDKDCDTDDIITSHRFTLDKEPKDWKPSIITDKTGEYSKP